MTPFEYVIVLLSIIVGLGLTRLLSGAARLVQERRRKPVYWVHLVWAASIFVALVDFWWWQFGLREIGEWTYLLYLFVVFYAVLQFLLAALLFPEDLDGYEDWKDFFYSRRRWFFGTLAAAYVVDLGDTLLKGWDYFRDLGPGYPLMIGLFFALALAAGISRSERFHRLFAIGNALWSLFWMSSTFWRPG